MRIWAPDKRLVRVCHEKTFVPKEGGSEETDVEEVTAVGSLAFVRKHRPDSWILRVRMEDELGNRCPVLRS